MLPLLVKSDYKEVGYPFRFRLDTVINQKLIDLYKSNKEDFAALIARFDTSNYANTTALNNICSFPLYQKYKTEVLQLFDMGFVIKESWGKYEITEELIDYYKTNGFVTTAYAYTNGYSVPVECCEKFGINIEDVRTKLKNLLL